MMSPTHASDDSFWNDALSRDLRSFLTGRLHCAETAADLTHETYLKLHQRNAERPIDNARALAFHIAVQLAIDFQRKAAVRNRYLADLETDQIAETIPAKSAEPEKILLNQQRLKALQAALMALPADCRTAFYLHGVDGLTYAQIADRMGISVAMVGKHLARALSHCAKSVD